MRSGCTFCTATPLAFVAAMLNSPFNTDVSGLPSAINSNKIQPGRWKAKVEGDICVFIVGAYINNWWDVATWYWTMRAPEPMMRELAADASIGFLGCINLIGNPTIQIQYWRSQEDLQKYAENQRLTHHAVWKDFNEKAKDAYGSNSVGVFHETFLLPRNSIISGYRNCPPTGLGRFTGLEALERVSPLRNQPPWENGSAAPAYSNHR
eukprot:jgi/Botrbrau1/9237/Bobra.0028s0032.1